VRISAISAGVAGRLFRCCRYGRRLHQNRSNRSQHAEL
jgi:hypothetical protein